MKNFNKDIGYFCEQIASDYLLNKNYKILERNYRTHFGEIDIVCIFKGTLIIIEVKGRYNNSFGLPRESVTSNKQKNIIKVCKHYISKHKLYNINVRFDVIEIFLNHNNTIYHLSHISDAFRL